VSVCSDPDWALEFVVHWEQLSPSVLSLLKANKRLSPSDKHTVIKLLVDEMKKCCPNPDFSQSVDLDSCDLPTSPLLIVIGKSMSLLASICLIVNSWTG